MSENIMTTVAYVQENDFDALIANETLTVVDFTASWCGPCRKISPLMDQLAEEFPDKATVVKLDIDQAKAIAKKYAVRSIPAVLMFKAGETVENIVGVKPYETFSEAVSKHS
ncbi:Thioredoxin [Acaryochloris thomasi RCC1774]|uniref:Thioredoxin n=1 Tax=Acaryochloris thomasi RCC1774 TaxID=1764569 RepID=A0A2W1JVW4_9CYAN|nr:thioredoxin [Acaryochloris thomasi]PZD72881.1 Thioredoxin [Acaryochloris thomasi RCC1774]